MLAWTVEKVTDRVAVLSGPSASPELSFDDLLNSRKIPFENELVRNGLPTGVDLPIGLGGQPPLAAATVLYVANGVRNFDTYGRHSDQPLGCLAGDQQDRFNPDFSGGVCVEAIGSEPRCADP
jgi:hypothetical protein